MHGCCDSSEKEKKQATRAYGQRMVHGLVFGQASVVVPGLGHSHAEKTRKEVVHAPHATPATGPKVGLKASQAVFVVQRTFFWI